MVIALTFMPPVPYSAAKLLLCTLTSCTMSLFSVTMTPLLLPDVDQRGAVELHGVARRPDAVDRVALRVVGAAAEADALKRALIGRDHAGQDAQQLQRAASQDRQVVDLLGVQHAFARASLRLDDLGLRHDDYGLGLRANLQPDVDTADIAGADAHRLLLVGLEAFELHFQVVGAGEDDSLVAATSVSHAGYDGLRVDVRDRDGRARKHAATAVLDRAPDGSRRGLGEDGDAGNE